MAIVVSELGALLVRNELYSDQRGFFSEIYSHDKFATIYKNAYGDYPQNFFQDNVSLSMANVVRGMHFQVKNPQGKYVRVLKGKVVDVIVDIRRDSKTFGKWESFELTTNGYSLYVPVGFAHGFWCLEDYTIFHYKCTTKYNKDDEDSLCPLDIQMNYPWMNKSDELIISDKDRKAKKWSEYV